jgi:hypothetical protein
MTIKLRRSDIFIAEYNKYGVSSGGAAYTYTAPPELTKG